MLSQQEHNKINIVIEAVSYIMALHDPYEDEISGHGRRTAALIEELAIELHIPVADIVELKYAAELHDIGKFAIPENILNKVGKLSVAGRDMLHTHPRHGADVLRSMNIDARIVETVYHHHENWDGTGYPDGLQGNDIPYWSRILSVIDHYDAMTNERGYHDVLPVSKVLKIMRMETGRKTDPAIYEIFEKMIMGKTNE